MATPESEAPLQKAMAAPNLMEHLAKGFDGLRAGTEAEAPEWASLLARMADGSALSPLAGGEAAKQADFGGIGAALGIEALHKQVEELRSKLADYDETLSGMKILMRGRGG